MLKKKKRCALRDLQNDADIFLNTHENTSEFMHLSHNPFVMGGCNPLIICVRGTQWLLFRMHF